MKYKLQAYYQTKVIPFLKEFARLLVFSLPALLIQLVTENPALTGTYGTIILYVLRSWDKSIHEDNTNDKSGLLPF